VAAEALEAVLNACYSEPQAAALLTRVDRPAG
jgi:hypothetical protein